MSIKIGRVLGVPVEIHASCIIALIILSFSIGLGFIARVQDGISVTNALVTGAVAAIIVFVGLLAHELAHAVAARKWGVNTGTVSLFIFGGSTQMNRDPEDWRGELAIAVSGPMASLGIAAGLGVAYLFSDKTSVVAVMLFYLAFANAVLGAANLLPGYPLDGGRAFKAILWSILDSRHKAARAATLMGECIGIGLAVLGLVSILQHELDGLWLLGVGWYLADAAARAWEQEQVRTILEQSRAADIITDQPAVLSPDDCVSWLPGDCACQIWPVADDSGPVGIVSGSRAVLMSPEKPVREVMTSRDELVVVGSNDNAWDVAERVGDMDQNGAVVVADGRSVIGVVEKRELPRLLINRLHTAAH